MSAGLDTYIDNAISIFEDNLWVGFDNQFLGRSYRLTKGGNVQPHIYDETAKNKKYKEVFASNKHDSIVHFDVETNGEMVGNSQQLLNVNILFAVNLSSIYGDDVRAVEQCKKDISDALQYTSFNYTGYVDQLPAYTDLYGLTTDQLDKFNMQPFYIVRFETTIMAGSVCETTTPVIKRPVTISIDGDGVTVPAVGSYQVENGTTQQLVAAPIEGNKFSKWEINGSPFYYPVYDLLVDGIKEAIAYFTAVITSTYYQFLPLGIPTDLDNIGTGGDDLNGSYVSGSMSGQDLVINVNPNNDSTAKDKLDELGIPNPEITYAEMAVLKTSNIYDFLINRPTAWNWADGINIYRTNEGEYYSDFDIQTKKNAVTQYIQVGENQDVKTLAEAALLVTSDVEIQLDDGEYFTEFTDFRLLYDYNIVCLGNGATVTNNYLAGNTAIWTDEGDYTYSMNIPNAVHCFDAKYTNLNNNKDYLQLLLVSDITTCKATINSYYIDGSDNVYIHLPDNRIPDDDIKVYTSDFLIRFYRNQNFFIENIDFEGGYHCLFNGLTGATLAASNCTFKYSTVGNGLTWKANTENYLVDCRASYNIADGFNYHASALGSQTNVYEENCEGSNNGWDGVISHNGSTIHEDGHIIRLNCTYENNLRNIHDIDNSFALMFNCIANTSRGADNEDDSFNLGVGVSSNTAKSYIYGGNFLGGANTDIHIYAGCELMYYDYPIADNIVVNDGTITEELISDISDVIDKDDFGIDNSTDIFTDWRLLETIE